MSRRVTWNVKCALELCKHNSNSNSNVIVINKDAFSSVLIAMVRRKRCEDAFEQFSLEESFVLPSFS